MKITPQMLLYMGIFLLFMGIFLFVTSLLMPLFQFGWLDGNSDVPGIIVFFASPFIAAISLIELCFGRFSFGLIGITVFLCNVIIVYSIHLFERLASRQLFKTLFVIVPLAVIPWLYPIYFPEALLGYYVWAASVTVIAAALVAAATSAHLHRKPKL